MTAQRSCLVLGGRGFVGSAVAGEAQRRGYRTFIVEKDDYNEHVGRTADVLINANGNSKKFLASQDPKLEFDLSVRSVQQSLHDFHVGLYVHLSSIDVYSDVSNPVNNAESGPIDLNALSPYGFHKYLAETLVRYYAPKWLIFRMGGFVGRNLWKNSIYDLLVGRPIRVHPDSCYQYLNTQDLARIVFDIVERELSGELFNVAGEGTVTLREVAAWIPHALLPEKADSLPLERYEVNIARIKAYSEIPRTETTVRTFITDVLAGKEKIA